MRPKLKDWAVESGSIFLSSTLFGDIIIYVYSGESSSRDVENFFPLSFLF